MNHPILVVGYNRPDFLRDQLDLLLARGSGEIFVYVAESKARTMAPNMECLALVEEYAARFPDEVRSMPRDTNEGAAASILLAVTRVLSIRSSVIVLEDDVRASEDFFSFITEVESVFCPSEDIWFLCGNQRAPSTILNGGYTFAPFMMPWGWVTTTNKWKTALNSMRTCVVNCRRIAAVVGSSKSARAMYWHSGLRSSCLGRLDAWDVPLWSAMQTAGATAILPPVNLVAHIGDDGREVHPPSPRDFRVNRLIERLPNDLRVASNEDHARMIEWYWNNVFKPSPWTVPVGWLRYLTDAPMKRQECLLGNSLLTALRLLEGRSS